MLSFQDLPSEISLDIMLRCEPEEFCSLAKEFPMFRRIAAKYKSMWMYQRMCCEIESMCESLFGHIYGSRREERRMCEALKKIMYSKEFRDDFSGRFPERLFSDDSDFFEKFFGDKNFPDHDIDLSMPRKMEKYFRREIALFSCMLFSWK